jgi:hypothetical protein
VAEEDGTQVRKPTDATASQGAATRGVVPNVVCLDLRKAQDPTQAAGFFVLWSEDSMGRTGSSSPTGASGCRS